jgi:protoheme IX farnesyltransferase
LKSAETIAATKPSFLTKVRDYAVLFKLRLSFLVVVSSVLGYLMAVDSVIWIDLMVLIIGGFLLTGSSNAFNQVWEKDLDKIMDRTQMRPLPQNRLTAVEALIAASIAGAAGIGMLWFLLNPLSGVLGLLALASYVFIYTPLKPISSLAVFVGAFPGAIPPMLGYVAGSGAFGLEPGILFAVQFMWQFPHFWAIAWVMDDDYKKGGFRLLPFKEGRSKRSSFQILLYTALLVPVSLLPWALPTDQPMTGDLSMIVALILGAWFTYKAYRLNKTQDKKDARKLMFASFIYLPIVQLIYVIDKL